ncbi:imidazoleglycerol-phosphate dehydratase HisB [Fervidibacillus albus]|uniref:Imidazoleglycerol-phosphate dehydratase n=1 Tax=Fervidibacillus albus TaxID=2980026 RepID=A0A9E8LWG2_9BACI|nr:imidazoleglycerol-phosphate dehydratase HisB [Fervidibacillus albus]WAA10978.1 imidazoleglycerol-phosphate dehydratase HisB [Fervidibacillus albus]
MRKSEIKRQTNETTIDVSLNLDEANQPNIQTGIGFFDHMLTLFASHGQFGLTVQCQGDLEVDNHHTVEDTGIVLGQAFRQAVGTKAGIKRYGTAFTPMDESLSIVSIDISGRPFLHFDANIPVEKVGTFDTELVEEFFRAFVNHSMTTVHINLQYGTNGHHIIESIFKGFGRALFEASKIDDVQRGVPSTKGIL